MAGATLRRRCVTRGDACEVGSEARKKRALMFQGFSVLRVLFRVQVIIRIIIIIIPILYYRQQRFTLRYSGSLARQRSASRKGFGAGAVHFHADLTGFFRIP